MKLSHNPNPGWRRPSAVLDADYEAEVHRTLEKARVAYERAERRLAAAQARLARVRKHPVTRKRLAELEAVVELRRTELAELARMMEASPQPARNRGTKSFRPVGRGGH